MVFGQMFMANLAVYTTASNVTFMAGQNPAVAVFVGIVVSTLASSLNGFLIVRFNLPPFIVTLGTLSIFTALTLILFKARTIQGKEMPDFMGLLGTGFQIGPFTFTLGLVVMLALYVMTPRPRSSPASTLSACSSASTPSPVSSSASRAGSPSDVSTLLVPTSLPKSTWRRSPQS
jgi:ribose/xylose/arabinose/galactoside ABC-type transport system permease subunit